MPRRRSEPGLDIAQAVALGVLHGPAELLPISSSGHVALVPWLFDWPYAELDPELRAVLGREAPQADERRAADRAEDVRPQRTAASPSSAFASAKKSGTGCTR